MANKDLINLGISPDSGTGDSARRGGEKINTLFADIYTQLGDNPVGQDPNGPFYAYRRPFYEYEYKVGELHPAGRFIPIQFTTTNSIERLYDSEWGWGYDSSGILIDSDADGIPDIYRDSEWYFLSRGETIDADFTNVSPNSQVHFVLPIGVPGDSIIIRDGFGTWDYSDASQTSVNKNITVSFWTTPWEFQSVNQIQEWETATGLSGNVLDSDGLSILDTVNSNLIKSNFHRVQNPTAVANAYPKLDQPFALSSSANQYDGLSPTRFSNTRRNQFEFLFTSYEEGWIVRQVPLDTPDIQASISTIEDRVDSVDSDLGQGLYVSADSDIRHSVPIIRRNADGSTIHGNLSLRGDGDSIMTTIDSEDTPLTNNPNDAGGGDTVQPLTTTIRFKLRDNVKVKDDLVVGKDVTVGGNFNVTEAFSIDSDSVTVNDTFKILDSDGNQRLVFEKANDWSSVANERPTVEPDYELHVKSNVVLGRDSDDVVVFNSRIASSFVPYGHELYNLGDSDNAWRDLYLSGNTIFLGSVKIKNEDGAIVFRDSEDNEVPLLIREFNTSNLILDSDLTVSGNSSFAGTLIVKGNTQLDSDVVVSGNLQIPGYSNVQHHLGTLDSDLSEVRRRLDSDELFIQQIHTDIQNLLDSEYLKNAENLSVIVNKTNLDSDRFIAFQTKVANDSDALELRLNAKFTEIVNKTNSDSDRFITLRTEYDEFYNNIDSDWIVRTIDDLVENKVDSEFVANLVADSEWILNAIDEKVEKLVDSDYVLNLVADSEWVLARIQQAGERLNQLIERDSDRLTAFENKVANDSDVLEARLNTKFFEINTRASADSDRLSTFITKVANDSDVLETRLNAKFASIQTKTDADSDRFVAFEAKVAADSDVLETRLNAKFSEIVNKTNSDSDRFITLRDEHDALELLVDQKFTEINNKTDADSDRLTAFQTKVANDSDVLESRLNLKFTEIGSKLNSDSDTIASIQGTLRALDSDWILNSVDERIELLVDSEFVANLVADSEWILNAIDEKVERLVDSDYVLNLIADSDWVTRQIAESADQDSDKLANYVIDGGTF